MDYEKSFLWMWVHSKTEEEKNKIIEMYINQNFKK